MKKRYLTITAHPDDEILGFGASSYVLTNQGHEVCNCILSGKVEARLHRPETEELMNDIATAQKLIGALPAVFGQFPNIKFNTVPHLDLVKFIEGEILKFRPDYILTHHPGDLNNDHRHVSLACQAATRIYQRLGNGFLKGFYFMEILSSTDWSYPGGSEQFQANTFLEIGEEGLNQKLKALEAYRGVMRDYPHPRSTEAVTGLAAYRGGQAGMRYAEAFQTVFQAGLN